ncbi:MAG: dehydrogenase [Candidatus Hydrogenedentota bacterium]
MAKNATYKAGVIAAGAIAQACHIPGYAKDSRSNFAAFADPAKARHTEVLKRYPRAKGYTDYREMLKKEQLDVVSVCTPNYLHAEATIAALEAGCHVLCEKPMAVTLREADRMIAAAKKAKRKLMVGFTHRLYRGPETCKKLLMGNAIGKPFMIRVRFAHGGPIPGWAKDDWFYDKKQAFGGAMFDMGIHAIDQCLWLMGPVASVSATAATLVKKINVDDNAVLMLEFESGALGYVEAGWTSQPGFNGIEIYGVKGSIICDYAKGLQLCTGKASAGSDSVATWKVLDKKPATGGWPVEIAYWLDVVEEKVPFSMDGQAGKDALAVALAAYKSNSTGRKVSVRG